MSDMEIEVSGISFRTWNNVPEIDVECYRWAAEDEPHFPLPAEAERVSGVPEGKLIRREWDGAGVSPGVTGTYELYIPAQYDGSETALMVFLDGSTQYIDGAHIPTVLDNMIAAGDIPHVIAVFHNSGNPGPGLPRYGGQDHRSIEYDATDDRFAIFLEDVLLRTLYVEYNITREPEKRAICGISSGANAAFTAAWHRPNLFRRVLCNCGSFTAIRGGERFPFLIRQTAKKPLKVFLQSGDHDLNICFGDWKLANMTMASALEYKGYEYRLEIGPGGHSIRYGAHIMPDALRWLWQ